DLTGASLGQDSPGDAAQVRGRSRVGLHADRASRDAAGPRILPPLRTRISPLKSEGPASHLAAGEADETTPAQDQDPAQCSGEEYLADVNQDVEPAHRELSADPARQRSDHQAPDGEEPSSESGGDAPADHQAQQDTGANRKDFLHDNLLAASVGANLGRL